MLKDTNFKPSSSVKIKCKKCGRMAPSDQFVLDHIYRMVVCPNCIKDREQQKEVEKKQIYQKEKEQQQKPGWDSEDDYLERAFKMKKESELPFKRISPDKIQYVCSKCKHQFAYNTVKKHPNLCPYCGSSITLSRTERFYW